MTTFLISLSAVLSLVTLYALYCAFIFKKVALTALREKLQAEQGLHAAFETVRSVTNVLEDLYNNTSFLGVEYSPIARQRIVAMISRVRQFETLGFEPEYLAAEPGENLWPFNKDGDVIAGKKP